MQRRENAILAGVGTTRRKFVVSKDEKKKKKTKMTTETTITTTTTATTTTTTTGEGTEHREEEDLYVRVPVHRYMATASGKLCKGKVNHKCLFSRDDTLDICALTLCTWTAATAAAIIAMGEPQCLCTGHSRTGTSWCSATSTRTWDCCASRQQGLLSSVWCAQGMPCLGNVRSVCVCSL